MGNFFGACLRNEKPPATPATRFSGNRVSNSSGRVSRTRSSTRRESSVDDFKMDDPVLREQALAAAAMILQQRLRQPGSALPFDRSASARGPPRAASTKGQQAAIPRSCSTRPRSLSDPVLEPHQLANQDKSCDDVETAHFVLVHGGGFGAWCWYKTIALLEEAGYKVTAIDLTGSGIHSFDVNGITSMSHYVKPLTEFLDNLAVGEKVILVGHDFGGACISYTMELFPQKISKAVFIAAAMLSSGKSTLELFSQKGPSSIRTLCVVFVLGTASSHQSFVSRGSPRPQPPCSSESGYGLSPSYPPRALFIFIWTGCKVEASDLMGQAQNFLYANGRDQPPTAFVFDKSKMRDLLFNQSPTKDVALASVSMRPFPFAPVLEKLSLSDEKYGSVRRFYIETPEDNFIPINLQEQMVNTAPPEQVFRLKGADHSPFFSKPQALHKHLVEISKLP